MLSYILLSSVISVIYCNNIRNASVTYDQQTNKFTVLDYIDSDAVATANFQNEIFVTGWSYLEVLTNGKYPDPVQAYAAGIVEGYLTKEVLDQHWYNTFSDYCEGEKVYCRRLSDFLQINLDFMKQNIETKRSYDVYWHQIALTLEQVKGLEDGYMNTISQPSTDLNVMGLLLLNLMGDLIDLEVVLKREKQNTFGSAHCSALVKILPNTKDIFFSHNTWVNYKTMFKVLKKYSLNLHTTMDKDAPIIPGHTCSFSSQPGMIFSGEDFYLISTGLASMETSNENNNSTLWQYVLPNSTILEWQRNIVANRLAKNGKQWAEFFGFMNSGTYNNQWMVLDFNKFTPGQPLQDGLLWVLEQLPGFLHSEDKTDVLRKQSYWPSYNIPYFKDVFDLSNGQAKVDQYGDYYSYDKAPRSQIFRRDHSKVIDIDSMIKLMRYNDYTNDSLSRCNCTPPYSANCAIAARPDLNPANGTYPFSDLGHGCSGATDMKLTTYELFQKYEFVAVAGPTYDPLPPFQWSKSDCGKTLKHKGQPDLWNFKPVIHKWSQ